jgi:hypothetical protein
MPLNRIVWVEGKLEGNKKNEGAQIFILLLFEWKAKGEQKGLFGGTHWFEGRQCGGGGRRARRML